MGERLIGIRSGVDRHSAGNPFSWPKLLPLNTLLRRFAGRIAVTLTLIVLNAGGWVLFPLVIGRAIDGVLVGSRRELLELDGLGIVAMGIAIAR